MTGDTIKIAELTIRQTNIGGIDIPIDLPGDPIPRNLLHTQAVGHMHEFRKWGVLKKKEPFFHT
jgi:hypothetical protein